jgi:hypothetical protein
MGVGSPPGAGGGYLYLAVGTAKLRIGAVGPGTGWVRATETAASTTVS